MHNFYAISTNDCFLICIHKEHAKWSTNYPLQHFPFFSGGRLTIKLGDKEVEYNPEFRFYICTKLSNPHYTPETSTKTTIVNFSVKEQGSVFIWENLILVEQIVMEMDSCVTKLRQYWEFFVVLGQQFL